MRLAIQEFGVDQFVRNGEIPPFNPSSYTRRKPALDEYEAWLAQTLKEQLLPLR